MKVEGWGLLDKRILRHDPDGCFLRIFVNKRGAQGDFQNGDQIVRVTLEIPDPPTVSGTVTKEEK